MGRWLRRASLILVLPVTLGIILFMVCLDYFIFEKGMEKSFFELFKEASRFMWSSNE